MTQATRRGDSKRRRWAAPLALALGALILGWGLLLDRPFGSQSLEESQQPSTDELSGLSVGETLPDSDRAANAALAQPSRVRSQARSTATGATSRRRTVSSRGSISKRSPERQGSLADAPYREEVRNRHARAVPGQRPASKRRQARPGSESAASPIFTSSIEDATSPEPGSPAEDIAEDAAESEDVDDLAETSSEEPDENQEVDESDPDQQDLRARSIAGWVFDDGGRPVPEIVVAAGLRGGSAGAVSSARTSSSADGYFQFLELGHGEYEVRTLETEDHRAARALLRTGVDSAVLVVHEKRLRQADLFGIVQDAEAGPIAGARVSVIGQKGPGTSTDEYGAYQLTVSLAADRQNYPVRFEREGFRQQTVNVPAIALDAVSELQVDAILDPVRQSTVVIGTVTGEDGLPVSRAPVQLFSSSLPRSYRGQTDDQGRFEIVDVELAQDYRVWLRPRERYKDYVEQPLGLSEGVSEHFFVLQTLARASLAGQMVDLTGAPVPGVSLAIATSQSSGGARTAAGDQQGFFRVDDLPAGEIVLRSHAFPRFTITGIRLEPDALRQVTIPLDTGAYVADGFLVDSAGRPVAGARISLDWSLESAELLTRSQRETVTDAQGYFLLTGLGSDPHVLTVSAPGFQPQRFDYAVSRVPTNQPIELLPSPMASKGGN